MKYNITVFGNKTTTADLVRHLRHAGHEISLIVTLATDAGAAKDISGAGDLASLAKELSIPVYVTHDYKLSSPEDKKFFAENTFDIGVCTGWQRLLPAHVLEVFPQGIFGFHGSCWKLPHGRGRSPLNWSLRLGADKIYHNCFRYLAAADAGDIFNTTEFPIAPSDNIASVQFKALLDMKLVTHRLLTQYKAGKIVTTPQAGGASIWLPKLSPEDGLVSFSRMTRAEILNLVNATARPFPGAFAQSADKTATLRIWQATPFEFPLEGDSSPVGGVIDCSLGQALIRCRDGLLLVTDYEFTAEAATLAAGLRFG